MVRRPLFPCPRGTGPAARRRYGGRAAATHRVRHRRGKDSGRRRSTDLPGGPDDPVDSVRGIPPRPVTDPGALRHGSRDSRRVPPEHRSGRQLRHRLPNRRAPPTGSGRPPKVAVGMGTRRIRGSIQATRWGDPKGLRRHHPDGSGNPRAARPTADETVDACGPGRLLRPGSLHPRLPGPMRHDSIPVRSGGRGERPPRRSGGAPNRRRPRVTLPQRFRAPQDLLRGPEQLLTCWIGSRPPQSPTLWGRRNGHLRAGEPRCRPGSASRFPRHA